MNTQWYNHIIGTMSYQYSLLIKHECKTVVSHTHYSTRQHHSQNNGMKRSDLGSRLQARPKLLKLYWYCSRTWKQNFHWWSFHNFNWTKKIKHIHISRVSCKKGPTCHAYAWQIGHFWQDTLDILDIDQFSLDGDTDTWITKTWISPT